MRLTILLIALAILVSCASGAQTKYDPSTQINWTKDIDSKLHGVTNGTAAQDVVTYSQLVTVVPGVTVGQAVYNDFVTDGTSDEDQINAAIDAAGAVGGRVWLTSPLYGCDGNINIDHDVIVSGGAMHSVHIDSTASTAVSLNSGATDNGCGLENVVVHGNNIGDGGTPVAGSVGVDILSSNSYLDNVKVIGFDVGITCGDGAMGKNLNTNVYKTYIEICNYGMVFNNTADVCVWSGRIGQNGIDGARTCGVLIVGSAEAIHFSNTLITNNGGWFDGIRIYGGYWFTFDNCDMETSTNAAMHFGVGNPTFVRVANCWINQDIKWDSTAYGARYIFDGNTFYPGKGFVYDGGIPSNITARDNDFLP
jgi:hypothetical protein